MLIVGKGGPERLRRMTDPFATIAASIGASLFGLALLLGGPTARAAAAACAPAPKTLSAVPVVEVREPGPGQHAEITLRANQPLALDFDPLDAHALLRGNDLTLNFPSGGVLVMRHVARAGVPLPTLLQLPDGTIVDACALLEALPREQVSPTAGKIPNEKIPLKRINPAAGPPERGHPVVTPFHQPGLGPGMTPDGPLPPEGYNPKPPPLPVPVGGASVGR